MTEEECYCCILKLLTADQVDALRSEYPGVDWDEHWGPQDAAVAE